MVATRASLNTPAKDQAKEHAKKYEKDYTKDELAKRATQNDPIDKQVAGKAKPDMPDTKLFDPSRDDPNSKGDMPTKQDDTNAESSMHNYIDAGGAAGVSAADAASEGKKIPDRTLKGKTEDEKTVEQKAKGKDPDGHDAAAGDGLGNTAVSSKMSE